MPTAAPDGVHPASRFDGRSTGAAAHVEHPFARLQPRGVEHHLTERTVHRLYAIDLPHVQLPVDTVRGP